MKIIDTKDIKIGDYVKTVLHKKEASLVVPKLIWLKVLENKEGMITGKILKTEGEYSTKESIWKTNKDHRKFYLLSKDEVFAELI